MINKAAKIYMVAIVFCLAGASAIGDVLTVGTDGEFQLPSQAALVAKAGDEIEIEGGEYHSDVAIWRQDDLIIRGLGAGASIYADGRAAEGKGIWVVKGNNTVIENIQFSGARASDRNGAGIRHEGGNLTIRLSRFFNNQNGILAGPGNGEILIENSIFHDNGFADGRSHSVYVGRIKRLSIIGSYFYAAHIGHHIKSRARNTYIACNKIMDGNDGDSSYLIDVPDGGNGTVVGNILQQGPHSENWALLSFSAEARDAIAGNFLILNNTFVNDRENGVFIQIGTPYASVHVQNNIFLGAGQVSDRDVRMVSNIVLEKESSWFFGDTLFVNRSAFDYRLTENSIAIDNASSLGLAGANRNIQLCEYGDIAKSREREVVGDLDVGALEYTEP